MPAQDDMPVLPAGITPVKVPPQEFRFDNVNSIGHEPHCECNEFECDVFLPSHGCSCIPLGDLGEWADAIYEGYYNAK